ncbi:hypothetical protein [Olsenella sp. An270]|uniref:hypothetical protein n=1 Tax=Olsenella sp. An270 TaxID=1965615 RepID=UPI000B38FD5E|nr:hypothetical protein [Olsenella sp. An270]OUO58503.1 hypothetical protein B5F73_08610 [Olsenella sp. An270]
MAKKASRTTSRDKGAAQSRFDDKKYGKVLFSATYDYNELEFARASETLGHGFRSVVTAAAFVALLALVVVLLVDNKPTALVFVTFGASLVLVFASTRWDRLQVFYARRTTLAAAPPSEQRHVAVCEDCVHVESEAGPIGDFDLSDLRTVRQNSDCIVAGFGDGRYAYVPRPALSENRFRELGRFLKGKLPQGAR